MYSDKLFDIAGTPLGDPIEVGALGQALSARRASPQAAARAPVAIASVKACFGHTEGAAGLTGALLAAQSLSRACAPAVMHLRTPNAYVETALADWRKQHRISAQVRHLHAFQCYVGCFAVNKFSFDPYVILVPY